MTAIDVSICPTDLECGSDGDWLDGDWVVEHMRAALLAKWPGARVAVQIGHTQGNQWYKFDGADSEAVQEVFVSVRDEADDDDDAWAVRSNAD